MRNLLAAALAVAVLACSHAPVRPVAIEVDVRDAARMAARGEAVIVDVREQAELATGMAAPAIWVATSAIEKDPAALRKALGADAGGRWVLFYCAAGRRAARAVQAASLQGFRAASIVSYARWVAAGLPTRAPSDLPPPVARQEI